MALVGFAHNERIGLRSPPAGAVSVHVSYRECEGEERGYFVHNQKHFVLDGAVGLHVDDFLGAGQLVNSLADVESAPEKENSFRSRLRALKLRYRFGQCCFDSSFTYCGRVVQQSREQDYISVSQETYMHAVKPISVQKARRSQGSDECTTREVGALRSLLGALQWPAAQSFPAASASVSFLQSRLARPTVEDLLEANKALGFMKSNADLMLTFPARPPARGKRMF